jgi:hypothetical protein
MPNSYDVAAEFVRDFPPGSTLTVAQLQAWARTQPATRGFLVLEPDASAQ